jgi:hypothetical protein
MLLAWFDLHASALSAIGMFVTSIASTGAWICTVIADRRSKRQINDLHRSLTSKHDNQSEML